MSDSYDDYEAKIQLAEHAWEIKEARHTFRKNRIKENKMSREAMQMALEALESDPTSLAWLINKKQAITVLRQALVDADDTSQNRVDEKAKREHEWVGLTDDDVIYFRYQATFCDEFDAAFMAELIEKDLKEKNHG